MPKNNKLSLPVPKTITEVAKQLNKKGFDAYIVGGCVRDLILERKPTDWDLTTNATPEEIQEIFEHTVYENTFGTVGVVCDKEKDPSMKVIEVTPYRKEGKYEDGRRPTEVSFDATLSEDLKRRDFTINSLAYNPVTEELVDEHGGIQDLTKGNIQTVGNPEDRFGEDALRLMRAVRIANQLEGKIEEKTKKAIIKKGSALKDIAVERIRDEFVKIIESDTPGKGVVLLHETGLLQHIVPELEEAVGIEQNQAHSFDVFEHLVRTVEHAGVKKLSKSLRLAALFHDISKPETRRHEPKKNDWSFHGHEVVGARKTKKILERLRFSSEKVEAVSLYVRWHMFFSDPDAISLSGVRRMVARVGEQGMWDLIDLRICDRIGTGRPKEEPYRLRKYQTLVEEVLRDPVTPKMLAIDGSVILNELKEKPGPRIGNLLHILLSEVIEDPTKNTKEKLMERAKELLKLPDEKLKKLGEEGKIKKFEENEKEIAEIRKKKGVN